jgi:superfamily II DNA or RNA helicase
MKRFRDLDLELSYASNDEHLPIEFFEKTFPVAKEVNLFLGYFSSNAIRELAVAFSRFILNDGKIKIITNDVYSRDDYENLIKDNNDIDNKYINIINDYEKLKEVLTKEDQHFFDCLRFLKKENRLKIQPVDYIGGKSHHKQVIMFDGEDYISTNGSSNFTLGGLILNGESFSVQKSWYDENYKKEVLKHYRIFNKVFDKKSDQYKYLDANSMLDVVDKIGDNLQKNELVQNSLKILKLNSKVQEKLDKIRLKREEEDFDYLLEFKSQPKFPNNFQPREYQTQAYQNWLKNNCQGLFSMATGTGKTITALNIILEEYKKNSFYRSIILVPTTPLLHQWKEDCQDFNFKNVMLSDQKDWRKKLEENLFFLKKDPNTSFILIAVNDSFFSKKSESLIKKYNDLETIIIIDEAHGIGTLNKFEKLPKQINKRIGLSATPKRKFDDTGTSLIEKYFNSFPPKYTYNYSMLKAIQDNYLSRYIYYPVFISLEPDELEKYIEISKKLLKHYDFKNNVYRKSAEFLLFQRKNIINKAKNKLVAMKNILDGILKNEQVEHTVVYVPEGYENVEDKNESNHFINIYTKAISDLGISVRQFGDKKTRELVIDQFKDRTVGVLTAMKTMDEGVDIPEIKRAIICSSSGNERQYIQRRGRILRKLKNKIAEVYDLILEPNNPEFWNYLDDDEKEKMIKIENRIFESELNRVINFIYACDNISDLKLKRNGFEKLYNNCKRLEIDIFEEIEVLRQ